jgi:predicted transcriptional regulator
MKARSESCGPSPFPGLPKVVDIRSMKPEPSIFDEVDDAADQAAMAEGEADLAAGRVISHEAIKAWLLSWGTGDERLPPQVGD